MKLSTIDTPEKFLVSIPRNLEENIQYRIDLHSELAKDTSAYRVYLELCYIKPQIFFNTALWTFNPKQPIGYRNIPFILRPQQELVVEELHQGVTLGHDLLIDKSRDEGATELVTKYFAFLWFIAPETMLLMGSRKEEYVDKAVQILDNGKVGGDHKCLFHKVLYGIVNLPNYMKPNLQKTHLHLMNLDNGSTVDGETTTENFGAGDRRAAILLDEFGRVDHRIAQSIRDSVADVTDCVIYNSTHFYGRGHPYGKLRFSGKCKVVVLPWYKNPVKNKGLYISPALDEIELRDKDYYTNTYTDVEWPDKFKLGKLEVDLLSRGIMPDVCFVADGTDKLRSPWYDAEEKRRDARDMAQNIDMNPMGAGDMFFEPSVLQRIRNDFIRKPGYEGEITYKQDSKDKIYNARFIQGGQRRFKWWGHLISGRPRQDHNYVVACDIALGTGSSNSVAKVYDADTRECVGRFLSPHLEPSEFCDIVIALCIWIGGKRHRPYLIWEANAGPGSLFDKRRRFHGYTFIYYHTHTRQRSKQRTNKPGWWSSTNDKLDLLLGLRTALFEGLKDNPKDIYLKIYDEDTVTEYEDFIFYPNGQVGLSGCADATGGAKAAHADTVIPDGLAILAFRELPKASKREIIEKVFEGTAAYRRWLRTKEQEAVSRNDWKLL